jgi:DNA-binding cell septation regulator SpoVG
MKNFEVEIFLTEKPGKVRGYGNITFFGKMKVNFRLIEGTKGMFVAYPSRKTIDKRTADKEEIWVPEFKILNEELGKDATKAVIEAYQAKLKNGTKTAAPKNEKPEAGYSF